VFEISVKLDLFLYFASFYILQRHKHIRAWSPQVTIHCYITSELRQRCQNNLYLHFITLALGDPVLTIHHPKLAPANPCCDDTLDSTVGEVAQLHGDTAFIFQVRSFVS
jgi:hypothetical protein